MPSIFGHGSNAAAPITLVGPICPSSSEAVVLYALSLAIFTIWIFKVFWFSLLPPPMISLRSNHTSHVAVMRRNRFGCCNEADTVVKWTLAFKSTVYFITEYFHNHLSHLQWNMLVRSCSAILFLFSVIVKYCTRIRHSWWIVIKYGTCINTIKNIRVSSCAKLMIHYNNKILILSNIL